MITGHTGFKGAWLSLWLQRLGAEVSGYALAPPTDPSLFGLADVAGGMRRSASGGEIRDLEGVLKIFRDSRPEIVMHLAAQSLVRPSYEQPVATFEANVMGTVHVLEAIRRTPEVRAAVVVTSDKCYENREWIWPYREDEPMGGRDPYSASKGCAELVTASYRRSFFADPGAPQVASARAGNVIGGGDWALDRLIPDLVRGVLSRRPVPIRSPDSIRPWQHVLEALYGYVLLAEQLFAGNPDAAGGWNFGPEDRDTRPVAWIVERLAESWREHTGESIAYQMDASRAGRGERRHPPEASILKLDSTKARTLLGWRPRLDLATALDWIVEWTRCYQQGGDVRALCEEQIDRFLLLTAGPREAPAPKKGLPHVS